MVWGRVQRSHSECQQRAAEAGTGRQGARRGALWTLSVGDAEVSARSVARV